MERMRAHVRGVFDQAATDAARAAGHVPRAGATSAYDDLRPDRVRLVYAYDLDAEAWCLGELMATRRRGGAGGAWEGNVVWTVELGVTRADWLPADRIQRGPALDDHGAEG